ncbi:MULTISPECIES: hypothetical protein [Streptomyces]|uniref:hypothetical protein n=1 Tax=Streptomyces TaxID=1883 RepID=UPI000241A0B7|nr:MULTISPECIES: hypothetical protein [Streptomyces]EHM27607.1 hypothetical protein SPW_4033 [Streptomyces sp. W007]MCX4484800.1 hypothetical protein [Streptomyces anulatus]MCX4518448.1 hypothetical protein [Streptomyces anulatus]MCX4601343.1 hypothetical protein [Streptomyces anulatus]WSI77683.1 hypothetical protein OG557_12305 [Streptomyces anulatus]
MSTNRQQLLEEAADLVWEHACSGCPTPSAELTEAIRAARRVGITIQDPVGRLALGDS